MTDFQAEILAGIPLELPQPQAWDSTVNHAPRRKDSLSPQEKVLALKNALRYFPAGLHAALAPEFADELERYGRIYMYRFRPSYPMYARPIEEYPAKCPQAAAIMAMIQNNLDPRVAQHPHELIIYGGNGAIFQNWAQYRLTMQYLATMTDEQTLVMYSGHPLGLFPSHKDAPRVIVTNGMVIPNYSMNAARKQLQAKGLSGDDRGGMLFVTAGLGGMSGAQPKAGNIAGVVSVTAEINPQAAGKRFELHHHIEQVFC